MGPFPHAEAFTAVLSKQCGHGTSTKPPTENNDVISIIGISSGGDGPVLITFSFMLVFITSIGKCYNNSPHICIQEEIPIPLAQLEHFLVKTLMQKNKKYGKNTTKQ
jgi:hypothetical protein